MRAVAGDGDHVRELGRHRGLCVVAATPGHDPACRDQRRAVVDASRDGHHPVQAVGHRGFAEIRQSPGDDPPVRGERQAVLGTGCHGGDFGQSSWHVGLPAAVAPPGDDLAVCYGEAVLGACRHRRDFAESGGHADLPEAVAAPGDHCSCDGQREAVQQAGRDGRDSAEARRHVCEAVRGAAQAITWPDEVTPAVVPASRDANHVVQARWHVDLALVVVAPANDGPDTCGGLEQVLGARGDRVRQSRPDDGRRVGTKRYRELAHDPGAGVIGEGHPLGEPPRGQPRCCA